MTKTEVIEAVKRRMTGQDFQGAIMTIIEDDVEETKYSWHIPVQPTFEPPNMSRYYEVLANIATDLLMDDDINVQFIPCPTEEQQTA